MALAAVAFELICLLLFFVAMFNVAEVVSTDRAPYGLRATGAVATFGLGALVGGAAAFAALRFGRRWLDEELLGAVLVVAVFNGFVFYFFANLATLLNESLWSIPFPLGGTWNPR